MIAPILWILDTMPPRFLHLVELVAGCGRGPRGVAG